MVAVFAAMQRLCAGIHLTVKRDRESDEKCAHRIVHTCLVCVPVSV